MKVRIVTNRQLFYPVLFFVVIEIITIGAWNFLAPMEFTEKTVGNAENFVQIVLLCAATNEWSKYFQYMFYGTKMITMAYLGHLGHLTRNVHTHFNESHSILLAVYSICLTATIITIVCALSSHPTLHFVLINGYVSWNSFFLIIELMPLRWWHYRNDPKAFIKFQSNTNEDIQSKKKTSPSNSVKKKISDGSKGRGKISPGSSTTTGTRG